MDASLFDSDSSHVAHVVIVEVLQHGSVTAVQEGAVLLRKEHRTDVVGVVEYSGPFALGGVSVGHHIPRVNEPEVAERGGVERPHQSADGERERILRVWRSNVGIPLREINSGRNCL